MFGICFHPVIQLKKLDPRSRKYVSLGFKYSTKGFILIDLNTKEIYVSRNVIFYKGHFPFITSTHHTSSRSTSHTPILPHQSHTSHSFSNPFFPSHKQSQQTLTSSTPYTSTSLSALDLTSIPQQSASTSPHTSHNSLPSFVYAPHSIDNLIISIRNKMSPNYLQDFHCMLATLSSTPQSSLQRYLISITTFPIPFYHLDTRPSL